MNVTLTAIKSSPTAAQESAVLELTPDAQPDRPFEVLLEGELEPGIAVGTRLWCGCGILMAGETVWAEFTGQATIRRVPADLDERWSWQEVLGPIPDRKPPRPRRTPARTHSRLVAQMLARPRRRCRDVDGPGLDP